MATDPADGQAVPDDQMAQGITVGVAAEGSGVPFDIVGEDAQQASDQLTSQGYQVTLEPRFSSRTYIGKISGSSPGPGSALDSGQAVTLYYGVDASADRDMLTVNDHGFRTATDDLSVLAGGTARRQRMAEKGTASRLRRLHPSIPPARTLPSASPGTTSR